MSEHRRANALRFKVPSHGDFTWPATRGDFPKSLWAVSAFRARTNAWLVLRAMCRRGVRLTVSQPVLRRHHALGRVDGD